MAKNQYVNKVTYGTKEDGTENVLIDLSKDSVDSAHLAEGYSAHDKTGAIINGVAKLGEGSIDISKNGIYDVKQYAEANVNVAVGVDTSEDTVSEYNLYYGATAHDANGEKITGKLLSISYVLNRNDPDCSSRWLVFPCPFEPKLITVSFLSVLTSSSQNNTVIDLMVWKTGAFRKIDDTPVEIQYYCGHSTGTITDGKFNLFRHQADISGNPNNVFYYENGKVHIASPSSTFLFSSSNYRLICTR